MTWNWRAPGLPSIPWVLNMKTSRPVGSGPGCQGLGGPWSAWPGSVLGSRPAGNPHLGNPPFVSLFWFATDRPQSLPGSGPPAATAQSRGAPSGLPAVERHGGVLETPSCRYWEWAECCSTGAGSSGHWGRPAGAAGPLTGGDGAGFQGGFRWKDCARQSSWVVGRGLAYRQALPTRVLPHACLVRPGAGGPTVAHRTSVAGGPAGVGPGDWLEVARVASGGTREARGQVDGACRAAASGRVGVSSGLDHMKVHWCGDAVGRHLSACIGHDWHQWGWG